MNKGREVYVSHGPGKGKIFLEAPNLYAPFGVSTSVIDKTGQVTESLDLSLKGLDSEGVRYRP